MRRIDPYRPAMIVAEKTIKEQAITKLPVNPIAIAKKIGIEVVPKPASTQGVSGMLLRRGNDFGIAYATHIDSIGFQHFSVAHELGHYFLPGHVDAVFADGDVHESRAGFASGNQYEMEADHFAATFLMPRGLFIKAMCSAGDGLEAIEKLAAQCCTSLTATAIRYTQCTRDPVAIVISAGDRINYCFMSDALKEVRGLNWIRKDEPLPKTTATYAFNQVATRVLSADRDDDISDICDWFGGDRSMSITEQLIGLGNYGKTLTVLTALNIEEQIQEIEEDEALIESWRPRFKR